MSNSVNPENIETVKDIETAKDQVLEAGGESAEGQLAVGHVPVPGTGSGTGSGTGTGKGKKKGSETETVKK